MPARWEEVECKQDEFLGGGSVRLYGHGVRHGQEFTGDLQTCFSTSSHLLQRSGSVNGHVQVATEVSLLLGEPADLTGNPLTDLMGEAPEGRELCLFASLEHQIGTKTIHPWIGPTIAGYEVGVLNLAFCNPVTESGRAVPSMKEVQKTGPTGRRFYSMEIDADHAVEFK